MHAKQFAFPCMTFCVCAVCEIALIRRELFVPISFCWRFEVYPTQTSVFFSKSNFVKLQMLWISWKCDAICTIAFPCMTFYVCITCELICSAGRACALLPQSYPFLFQRKNCVSVNAIEFLHKWCYGFSNEILTHVQHGNEYNCYAAWTFSGNM